jgi:hypothetical protein
MDAGRGRNIFFFVLAVLAGTGLGCDWGQVLGDPDVLPPPSHPPARDAATPGDGAAGDDVMCRHYCQALEETDLLVCASPDARSDLDTCKATVPTADSCFALRCASGRVDVALCLAQCDSLASVYDAHCPGGVSASDPLCPSSQAAHDQACRAGCTL